MGEGELEAVMMDYLRGGADVLVCTSIIESGIDIPQANTLIVEHADTFGLAQLYQIRGRVGRSRERAYAYLLYDSAAALTLEAAQRLSALSDYTELGAGFKIAMRDLEIRGAGNLLGDEQSGHVAALGFELYMQMLDEAVRNAGPADGEPEDELPEPVRLDVNVDAYVPADYVPYEQAKIEVHRRVAAASRWPTSSACARSSRIASGPCPSRLTTCWRCSARASSSARPAPKHVSFRGDRLAVTPIELDSVRRQAPARGAARGAVRVGTLAGVGARPAGGRGALPDGGARRRRAACDRARGGLEAAAARGSIWLRSALLAVDRVRPLWARECSLSEH